MEPLDYLRTIARRWRIVAVCALLSGAGAYATAPAGQDAAAPSSLASYTATASVLADPSVERNLAYTQLFMQRGELPTMVADELGQGESGPATAARVTVGLDETVGMITISATGTDAPALEDLVDTYADTSIAYFDAQVEEDAAARADDLAFRVEQAAADLARLDREVADDPSDAVLAAQRAAKSTQYEALLVEQQDVERQGAQSSGLSVLEYGTALQQGAATLAPPVSGAQRLLLGLGLGALLGAVLALVADRLDTRVRSRQQVQEITASPVVAEVPRLRRVARRRSLPTVLCEPGGAFAESHRALRSALTLMTARRLGSAPALPETAASNRVVLVVSGRAGEGKTTTVVNLAATIAATGRSVVVVDADLRRPSLARALGVPAGPGLADAAAPELGTAEHDAVAMLQPTRVEGVRLLAAGSPQLYTSVSPSRMVDVVRAMRGVADTVLVDVAPLVGTSNALDLVTAVDSALVVVRAGSTTTEQLRHTAEILERTQVPVIGSVLVGVPRGASYGFGGGSDRRGRVWGGHSRTHSSRRAELQPVPRSRIDDDEESPDGPY